MLAIGKCIVSSNFNILAKSEETTHSPIENIPAKCGETIDSPIENILAKSEETIHSPIANILVNLKKQYIYQ
jgi:hypothetical protein